MVQQLEDCLIPKRLMPIKYIEPDDLNIIIKEIRGLKYSNEPPADYATEIMSIDNYFALIDRISSDGYYPGIYRKASVLYINLIIDHVAFFSNGNKRMATFSMIYFMNINGYELGEASKESYREELERLFPENEDFEDFEDFNSADFLTYNLSLIVAKHTILGITYDDLKEKVEEALTNFFNKS